MNATDRSTGYTKSRHAGEDVTEVLAWLTPDLRTTLAGLDGAPPSLATAVIQLLPFGSRAALMTCKVAMNQAGDSCSSLELTPLGFRVIHAAAMAAQANPDGVVDWLRRAEMAAEASEETHLSER